MLPSPQTIAIESLATRMADLLCAQADDLREFARAIAAGEGTIHLEKHLRNLEIRRAELYRQLDDAAFGPPAVVVIAPNELELPEDN